MKSRAFLSALAGTVALGVVVSPMANADVIVSGIPTFGGGNENITSTLAILDAINPDIVYLGSYLDVSPGAVSLPLGESITGTGKNNSGTITSVSSYNIYTILYYDVKAGDNSDLIEVGLPGTTVNWTTDWANLLVGKGNVPDVSHIDVFGIDPPQVPEPASVMVLGSALLGFGMMRRRRRLG